MALVIGSDDEEILIDANFSGQDLLVFGAFYGDPSQPRDEKGDLLIEVIGPSEDIILRKKKSFETLILYFETLILYFETLILSFETLILYFETLILYFETLNLSFEMFDLFLDFLRRLTYF